MSKLVWDASGTRYYRAGVSQAALYVPSGSETTGQYAASGVAWSGMINITKSPDGAEANDLWADNIKYGSIRSSENMKGSMEAYDYPSAFNECMGIKEAVTGVLVGMQPRKSFGLAWRTEVGDDVHGAGETDAHYILHLIWGATVNPVEEANDTINDSPDAQTMSWDWECVPQTVENYKPTAAIDIDSRTANATKLAALEAALFGDTNSSAYLPTPAQVISMMTPPTN